MTALQFKEVVDTLNFDIEWKKLIKAKKRHLNNPRISQMQKWQLKKDLVYLKDDLLENDIDIERLVNRHLPPGYMDEILNLLNTIK